MSFDLRVAGALRPTDGDWTLLNRLDLVATETDNLVFVVRERKLVNNFAANFKPNARNQLALLFGAKQRPGSVAVPHSQPHGHAAVSHLCPWHTSRP